MPKLTRARPLTFTGVANVLTGLGVLVASIPGFAGWRSETWWPPESDLLFGTVALLVAYGTVGITFLYRSRIKAISRERVSRLCGAALVSAVACVLAYSLSTRRFVVDYPWVDTRDRVVVPPFVNRWAPPRLDSLVAFVNPAHRPRTADAPGDPISLSDLTELLSSQGAAAVEPCVPALWRNATISGLLVVYSLGTFFMTFPFLLLAIKLRAQGAT